MNKFKKTRGLTLVELITIMALTSLFALMAIRSLNSNSRKREMFNNNFDDVISLFKTARNYAMSNKQISINGGDSFVPEGGFGVHANMNLKTFTLFADTNDGNEGVGDSPNGPNEIYDYSDDGNNENDDVIVANVNSVTITDVLVEIEKASADNVTFATGENEFVVIFKPLDAETIINKNDGNNFNDLEVIFTSPVRRKSFHINKVSRFFDTEVL